MHQKFRLHFSYLNKIKTQKDTFEVSFCVDIFSLSNTYTD